MERVHLVAFESELIDLHVLEAAMALNHSRAQVLPSPKAMGLCSDKLEQKRQLDLVHVPTAAWETLPTTATMKVSSWLSHLKDRFPAGFVLKWSRGGYDGRGTLIHHVGQDPESLLVAFIAAAAKRPSHVYAEQLVPFETELAVISTRAADGRLAQYPPVITRQSGGVCVEVQGPAVALGVSARAAAAALEQAQVIGTHFDLVGTFAVEFFVLNDERVLVNEIAPRVHNSGHFSLDGAECSQFENHWRALSGAALGPTETSPFFGMINILGPEGYSGPVPTTPAFNREGIVGHWYHKTESRPGRKMGHINVTAPHRDLLDQRLVEAASLAASWQLDLQRENS
jgi:5-(carboxyamino)imidazole ribonucleotide synthase